MKRTLNAYNGRTRGDGYDAHMRPVRRTDNAPGGAKYRVEYSSLVDRHERVLWCDSEEEARHATLYGAACVADPS